VYNQESSSTFYLLKKYFYIKKRVHITQLKVPIILY